MRPYNPATHIDSLRSQMAVLSGRIRKIKNSSDRALYQAQYYLEHRGRAVPAKAVDRANAAADRLLSLYSKVKPLASCHLERNGKTFFPALSQNEMLKLRQVFKLDFRRMQNLMIKRSPK